MGKGHSSPEYLKAWKEKNRGHVRDYERNYRQNNEAFKKYNRERARKYYLTHKQKWEKDRLECLSLLGNRCKLCGFSDKRALQIDHVNGKGREERRKQKAEYYRFILAQLKAGSKDYQCLCANCNWIKRVEKREN